MIYLGECKAGELLPWAVRFHSDQGTAEDPSSPTARTRSPSGTWASLAAPAKLDGVTGLFGGTVATAGYAPGLWLLSVQGQVSTGKTVGTVLSWRVVERTAADLWALAAGRKRLLKVGEVWSLVVYAADGVTPLLAKPLKDKNGNDLPDPAAGILADELAG